MGYSIYEHRRKYKTTGKKDTHQLQECNYLWGSKKKGEWD